LRIFGVLFGKAGGSFALRAGEIVAGELDASTPMRVIVETLMQARIAILDRIKVLDRQVLMIAKKNPAARLFMTAPGVGAIIALSVASVCDDAERFKRSSSAGAYLGLTPRRYESGEVSRNGRISKHGNQMIRKHLYEAATTLHAFFEQAVLQGESATTSFNAEASGEDPSPRRRLQHVPCRLPGGACRLPRTGSSSCQTALEFRLRSNRAEHPNIYIPTGRVVNCRLSTTPSTGKGLRE
jgi:hypothetical protein